jgi:sugar lactone lactonase YvrE
MPVRDVRVLRDDLMFGEAPRWHDGKLYVSDFYAHEVIALGLDGSKETVVEVPDQPGGLGFLPNGDLIVVSMRDATVRRWDGSSLATIASITDSSVLNDMAVSAGGRVYVGGMPDLYTLLGDGSTSAVDIQLELEHLYVVDAETGDCRIAARDLDFPNGAVITPDGSTLIIAETMATRLSAFDVEPDGSLTNRRVWAELGVLPDGICLDAEGCVWVAVPHPEEEQGFIRVAEGGEVKERYPTDRTAVAMELGGPDGTDFFMLEATVVAVDRLAEAQVRGNGRVMVGTVDVPGAAFV